MTTFSELITSQRRAKRISLTRAAQNLKIKKQILEALESAQWHNLPEPTFVKGFIKNYAQYLGLDPKHVLALYRREFDESQYPPKTPIPQVRRIILTPTRIINFAFILAVLLFIAYLASQYSSILARPKLKVFSPADDITTSVRVVAISGQTEKGATVSIDGELVPVDSEGNFSYEYKLQDGQNTIEIIAAKRLSPKSKVTKIIRLSR